MTKEEAIKFGERVIALGLKDESHMFCEMAIEALKAEPCEDAVSRQAVLDALRTCFDTYCVYDENNGIDYIDYDEAVNEVLDLPPVNPKQRLCKDCKWWKDSDGLYRRGGHAESRCPINRREVFEGNGYCYMFEPQEKEDKE